MGVGLIFIGAAAFIDGLQAWLDVGLFGAGGAIAGATAVPTLGLGAAAFPLGIALGFAVNFIISATLGVMLVVGLGMFGLWDTLSVVGGSFFEIIPGLDALPGWTLMTVRCVLKAKAKEGSGVLSKVAGVASTNTPVAAAKEAASAVVGNEVYA